jgi:amidase
MNRRKFIQNSSLVAAAPLIISACSPSQKSEQAKDQKTVDAFSLNEITMDDLQKKMQSGELTARSITELYLNRIQTIDKSGPTINSVIEINPDAMAIADAMDAERKAGKVRGPMHGIPVLIKDNINSGDKMMTTAGSIALEGNVATADAFIIKKLRESGAVLLGKTNLSEWANFRSNRSASGWSSRGGQTRNPYVLDRNPCGSSSGSGAAVSANLCAVAIGTETNGSIICPASINGVVGIKPTVGLWSRSGIIPISATQDTAGPMTRTVRDAAILLGAGVGIDDQDAITKTSEGKSQQDYTKFLDANGLAGKRIGIEKSYLKNHEGIDALLQKAISQMKEAGAKIMEVDFLEKMKGLWGDEYQVLLYEFKDGLNKYLSSANGKVKSLAEVIAFNKQNEGKAMPYFKQDILEESQAKGDLTSKEYQDALKNILTKTRDAISDTLEQLQLHAIAGPSYGPSWCIDWVNGDYSTGYGFSSPAAIAGFPHITVPMGFVSNLPIGISFFSKAYDEGGLLTLAFAYEQLSKNRMAPGFLKTNLVG